MWLLHQAVHLPCIPCTCSCCFIQCTFAIYAFSWPDREPVLWIFNFSCLVLSRIHGTHHSIHAMSAVLSRCEAHCEAQRIQRTQSARRKARRSPHFNEAHIFFLFIWIYYEWYPFLCMDVLWISSLYGCILFFVLIYYGCIHWGTYFSEAHDYGCILFFCIPKYWKIHIKNALKNLH